MEEKQLTKLLLDLVKQPNESEWVEFKLNYHSDEEIGERISALSNGACLHNQQFGYLVFGVKDGTHSIEGTTFKPKTSKRGKEDLEHWLLQRLNPRIDFSIYEFDYEGRHIAIFIIPATINQPVEFLHQAYIRVSSITRKLNDFPEKQRKIWKKSPEKVFELEIALNKLDSDQVVKLVDVQAYFDLLDLPLPSTRESIIEKFISERLLTKNQSSYSVTNLGAILFAKNLADFPDLARKSIRVIVYKGKNKIETIREQIGVRGYAVGFDGLINWVNSQLPANEEIGKAFRTESTMYPEIAVRELVANAIIHQDFRVKGYPTIEIYSDRIEISNPGLPLITPTRFIDEYQSRNERLADLMRRLKICEEKGSGIDKVIFSCEVYQLPAPDFRIKEAHTSAILFSYLELKAMEKEDKLRACYQHAALKYVSNEKMTNQSLRERFKIEDHNAALASRIIRDTLEEGLIKEDDPSSSSRKYKKYIPFWA